MFVADQPEYLEQHDTFTSMPILARLRRGVSETQALAVTDAIFKQYMSEPENSWARLGRPDQYDVARLLPAAKGGARLRRQYTASLQVLMALVALVLLIASANVANLLLARSAARAKEIAIRLCVGGGRGRLVRLFLTESTLLAVAGALAGILLASWGTELIVSLLSGGPEPIVLDVSLNTRVLVFTAAVALGTGILFGLAPALRATKLDLTPALKENGTVTRTPARRWGTGNFLVAGQLALCVVVVAVAALLARSVYNLKAQDAGFDPEGVVTFYIDAFGKPFSRAELSSLYDTVVERMERLPGVISASGSMSVPIHTSGNIRGLHLPDLPPTPEARGIWTNPISLGYFDTMGIRLLKGRAFTTADRDGAPQVAILNETAARYLFGADDPIGRTFLFMNAREQPVEVIGIAPDTYQTTLREPAPRMAYTPLAQERELGGHLLIAVRARNVRNITADLIRATVSGVTTDLVADDIRTMSQQINSSLVRERTLMSLSSAFAVLALVLACVGLYGVMSYALTRRTREIGIRLALGARPVRVLWGMLRETLLISLAGVGVGVAGAWFATRTVSTFLFGLSPRDPPTLVAVCATLLLTTLVAGYLPARRAAAIDPARAIRNE